VLVSATTAALVDPDRFELLDLGYHRLKDLTRPERIFQLGSGSFPPVRSLSPSNLPAPATPFLGRRRELEQVTELLVDGYPPHAHRSGRHRENPPRDPSCRGLRGSVPRRTLVGPTRAPFEPQPRLVGPGAGDGRRRRRRSLVAF
jgi:hypothetical protein